MDLLQEIDNELKNNLSEKRYNHSLGVMEKAEELAKIYNVDINTAKLVGLAHDIAKEIPENEKIEYVEKNNIQIDDIEKNNISLLHGKIGADICKKKYGFTQEMADAIEYHTTAKTDMTVLSKIIYVADKIEKNRTYSEVEDLRQLANIDLDKAILYTINEIIIKNIERNKIIHPESILARNQLLNIFS